MAGGRPSRAGRRPKGLAESAALLIALAWTACGSVTSTTNTTEVRGDRYCEILLGTIEGQMTALEVYNTYGINDCPADAWTDVSAAQIQSETGVDLVELNGPRVWMMDEFSGNTELLDPTVKNLDGVEMRLAGVLNIATRDLPAFVSGSSPYEVGPVTRNTVWIYDGGKPLYQLIDPQGRIFVMQSFSQEIAPLTFADLPTLGSRLDLPDGWVYREAVPTERVDVVAVDGVAQVTQDELKNSYQLSTLAE